MRTQFRHLSAEKRPQSGQITSLSVQFLLHPDWQKSAVLQQESFSWLRSFFYFKSAVLRSVWVDTLLPFSHQKTARLNVLTSQALVTPSYGKTARLGILSTDFENTTSYRKSARLLYLTILQAVTPVWQKSARVSQIASLGDWTTGSQVSPTSAYQKSARILDLSAAWTRIVSGYQKSGRLRTLTQGYALPSSLYQKSARQRILASLFHPKAAVYQKSARISFKVISFIRTSLAYQKSAKLRILSVLSGISLSYQRSARFLALTAQKNRIAVERFSTGIFQKITSAFLIPHWNEVLLYDEQQKTETPASVDIQPFITHTPFPPVFVKIHEYLYELVRTIVTQLTAAIPTDPEGDMPDYYWIGWSQNARGKTTNDRSVFSLYEVPATSGIPIEIWYERNAVDQADATRKLESDDVQTTEVFDLTDKVLPEIAQYIPVLNDYLLARHYDQKASETDDLDKIKLFLDRSMMYMTRYYSQRDSSRRMDAMDRKSTQYPTLKPIRL